MNVPEWGFIGFSTTNTFSPLLWKSLSFHPAGLHQLCDYSSHSRPAHGWSIPCRHWKVHVRVLGASNSGYKGTLLIGSCCSACPVTAGRGQDSIVCLRTSVTLAVGVFQLPTLHTHQASWYSLLFIFLVVFFFGKHSMTTTFSWFVGISRKNDGELTQAVFLGRVSSIPVWQTTGQVSCSWNSVYPAYYLPGLGKSATSRELFKPHIYGLMVGPPESFHQLVIYLWGLFRVIFPWRKSGLI